MSDAVAVRPMAFDDRVDVNPVVSNRDAARLVWRCLRYLATVKGLFAAKIGLAFVALIPGLIAPWTGKILIDQVILQKPFDTTEVPFPPYFEPFVDLVRDMAPMEIMLTMSAMFIGLLLVFGRGGLGIPLEQGRDSATVSEGKLSAGASGMSGLFGAVELLVDIRLNQRLANGFRTQLFARLARLPMATIDDHRIGDSVYRVMYDAPDLPGVCSAFTLWPLFTVVGVLIALYLMGTSYSGVAPEIIWVSLAVLPISFFVTVPLSGFVRRIQQASRASGTATTNAIEESMSNLHAVQSLGGMDRETKRVESRSRESFRRFRHVVLTGIGIGFIYQIIAGLLAIFVTVFVVNRIFAGVMTPGDYFVLIELALTIGGSGLALGMIWIDVQSEIAAVRRVFFFLDMKVEEPRAKGLPLPPIREGVRFDRVSLRYANGHEALRDVSLDLNVGELVAVVGPTGAGKTSLAYLVPAYYRATRGRVLIDGIDIGGVDTESLRSQVSYVFQEHLLQNESIRSNLLLANPDATDADLVRACETAGAMDFIADLPTGLDHELGRSGDTLSVGQKQRLCIARGLVRDTRILILDEPTAALDPQAENALVRSLRAAAAGRLVVVIAHRLSTIRRADRIVFLEDGEVRDIGTHEALMGKADGPYRRFVDLQGG
ncbi:MAG: ABC transporter ATP-binding protein [Gammaproteobacteria bacterium]|nr:ABC transporter ATP-binding protein [Gammaproteobacteria bacterium]